MGVFADLLLLRKDINANQSLRNNGAYLFHISMQTIDCIVSMRRSRSRFSRTQQLFLINIVGTEQYCLVNRE